MIPQPSEMVEETPFYVRSTDGATGFLPDLESALQHFASEDGYRLTITIPGVPEIVFRKFGEIEGHVMFQEMGLLATNRRRFNSTIEIREVKEASQQPEKAEVYDRELAEKDAALVNEQLDL